MLLEKQQQKKTKYRSKLEQRVAQSIESDGFECEYESVEIRYTIPSRIARYTPDFRLPNGILVEVKGLWDATDRRKQALVRAAHPELDIRLVFANPWNRISKQSDTTYADYCDKMGWKYAKGRVPSSWMEEPRKEVF
jgi:hypothetical protein